MPPALIGARWLHEAALAILFGAAAFPLYAGPGLIEAQPGFAAWRSRRLALMAALALVGGLGWLAFTAAGMSGEPADATRPAAWLALVTDTDFGRLWAVRLGVIAALLVAIWRRASVPLQTALAAVALGSLAWTGHADLPESWLGQLHRAGDVVHLLAAGLWIGALWALGRMAASLPEAGETEQALRRFSGAGQLAVAALIATGLLNAYTILGDFTKLITTTYGRLLDLKLAAFAGMLVLAALNRFVLVPRMAAGGGTGRLRRQILGEQALSLVVLAVVAAIGTIDPNA
jgi:putative copper resistance protein D